MADKKNLSEKIYEEVLRDIRNCNIKADAYIVENDLCVKYGISKGTAGDVLARLTQNGMMVSHPRKGYRIVEYTKNDFGALQMLRFSVECFGIHRIIENKTYRNIEEKFADLYDLDNYEFHVRLASVSGDFFLVDTVKNLANKAVAAYNQTGADVGDDTVFASRHEDILKAIAAGDEQKALDCLKEDMRISNETADSLFEHIHWNASKTLDTEAMKDFVYISRPELSGDGKTAACVSTKAVVEDGTFVSDILLTELKNKKKIDCSLEGHSEAPVFIDNGKKMAYLGDASGEKQIYVYDLAEKASRKITSARHGVTEFAVSADGAKFVFTAKLWKTEMESDAFTEMSADEKKQWLEMKDWEPKEITQIDYKRDECHGVRDGSISCICTADTEGNQKLVASDIPFSHAAFSPNGLKIACYGQPHTGAKFSSEELFIMNADGSARKQLSDNLALDASFAPAFTEDDSSLIVPAYYMKDGCMILYLYQIPAEGGEAACLFDSEAEEVCSGVYGMPLQRTQRSSDRRYYDVIGDYVYFLSVWYGDESLYRMPVGKKSVPELVAGGKINVHEFSGPVNGKILVTGAGLYTIRDLHVYDTENRAFTRILNSNDWIFSAKLGETEKIKMPSRDGKETIYGWLTKPVDFIPGKKYPAVLYVHGGPSVCFTSDFWHEIQILSNAGYAVVWMNPRGSSGAGLKYCSDHDAFGTEAYDDIMGFLDKCISYGFIDENRLGITGGSYGGYMTLKIIMATDRFKAAVGQRVLANRATSYGTGDQGFYSASEDYSKVVVEKCLIDRARVSLIKDMDKIKTPLLLLHGAEDYRCSFEQSEQMFISMHERRKEIPVRLVRFPGENHEVSRTGLLHHQQQHVQEMVNWFNRFLKEENK